MKLLVAFILLFNTTAFAECKAPVQYLQEGDKAQCTGYLFSPEQEKIAAEAYEDALYYKSMTEKLENRLDLSNKQIGILEARLNLYVNQSNLLAEQVVKQEDKQFWQNAFYFGLGVLATGLAVYGAAQLNR